MPEPTTIPELLNERLIRAHFVPVASRTLARWISSGRFPRADVKFGGKVRLWRRETIQAWIAKQVEEQAA